MSNTRDAIDGLTASLIEDSNGKVGLDGYSVEIVTECQNNCGTEFESPVIVLSDSETAKQRAITCWDCPETLTENDEDDDEDNEEMTEEQIIAHDAAASAEILGGKVVDSREFLNQLQG